jgi:hypothetical protein
LENKIPPWLAYKEFYGNPSDIYTVEKWIQSVLPGRNTQFNLEAGVCGAAKGTCVVVWTRVVYIYAV